jgi:fructoselysine 6-kinase
VSQPTAETLLFGALSLDIYTGRDLTLPGGGALNMAWHWRRQGIPFQLLTRVGSDRPDVFLSFLDRHGIPYLPRSIVGEGRSASIDIAIQRDRQPHMDHFVEGVWAGLQLTVNEQSLVHRASRLHAVLVEGAIGEIHRLGRTGRLAHLTVSADFLGFRHYTVDRFAETMRYVDLGFVGWPGDRDHPTVAGIRDVAFAQGKLVVVTLGSRGVVLLDGVARDERFIAVRAIPVFGTTVGCGDAFIAGFLAARWRGAGLDEAVDAGATDGALATGWRRPLPDVAYGEALAAALRSADEEWSADEEAEEDEDESRDGDAATDTGLTTE